MTTDRSRGKNSAGSWPGRRGKWLPFVLLRHRPGNGRAPHFDLLVEIHPGEPLWGLETAANPRHSVRSIRWRTHGFHRRRYLNYEGDIGKGRGVVKREDKGAYRIRRRDGVLIVELDGDRWRGAWRMVRIGRGRHAWVPLRP